MKRRRLRHNLNDVKATTAYVTTELISAPEFWIQCVFQRCFVISLPYFIQFDTTLEVMYRHEIMCRGQNKPKLPLVRRISDMLKITCPHTCSLVQVPVHFVGPNLDALDRQNRIHESHRFFF